MIKQLRKFAMKYMRLSARNKICIIIGDPVDHSLSPAMHNAAYEKLGIDNEFVYLGANVKINEVKNAVQAMRSLHFRGLTCTMPHKIEVMKYLDKIDPVAKKIGAVNTVVNEDGILTGYNTDWLGVVAPLEKLISLRGKKIAVFGAGGAARAILYGVLKKKAKVTIFNRTLEKAQELAKEFGCLGSGLDELDEITNFDIIINSTSVGMKPLENQTPIPVNYLTGKQIVFDIVYVPYETRLLHEAEKRGAKIIRGIEMLLYQGVTQFGLYTNRKAPVEVMRKVLL